MSTNADATPDKIWDLIDDFDLCMLVTSHPDGPRARPMSALRDRKHNCIRFIADARQAKDDEIAATTDVCVTFSDARKGIFVSITGAARIEHDQDKVRQHWTAMADMWFDKGKCDPNAIVIEVTPRIAQYWEGPGLFMRSAELLKSHLSGARPDPGNNETVRM